MRINKTIVTALALGVAAWTLSAQPADGPRHRLGPPPDQSEQPSEPRNRIDGEGHRPPPPLIGALDANHDGVIDEKEIANASAALKSLDKNGDGKLTMDELRPPRPEGAPDGAPKDGSRRRFDRGGPDAQAPDQGERPMRHRPPPDQ